MLRRIRCTPLLALSIWINNLYKLLQTTVEPQMRGRVVSLNKVLMQQPTFWLVSGVVASVLGHLGTLLLGGGELVILHLAAYLRTPELRQVEPALRAHPEKGTVDNG